MGTFFLAGFGDCRLLELHLLDTFSRVGLRPSRVFILQNNKLIFFPEAVHALACTCRIRTGPFKVGLNAQPMSCMPVDCEVYMVHPCLLDKARDSQPCSSCGLPSVLPSLPFGLRDPRQINAALVPAQLAPQIHKTFSPVSGPGTRRCTADPGSAIPSAVALGQKGGTLFMGFTLRSPEGKLGLSSLYPHRWVYLIYKEPKPPF